MNASSVFLLLKLFSLQLIVVALPTLPSCHLRGIVVLEAHHLFRDVGGKFPAHCLPYNANITFPDSSFPTGKANHLQCRQALSVVYETLKGVWTVFEDHGIPEAQGGVTWDESKLDDFLNLQNQLLSDGSCLSSADSSVLLSPYFSNVTAVLQQQDSAVCGWMALKRDLLNVLEFALQKHQPCFKW